MRNACSSFSLRYLGQRGQQPLRVVQSGPAVGQAVGHVPQLLPDWRKPNLDLIQAFPVKLAPAFQITEYRQSLTVQLLNGKSFVQHHLEFKISPPHFY